MDELKLRDLKNNWKMTLADDGTEALFVILAKALKEDSSLNHQLRLIKSNYKLNKSHQISGIADENSVDLVQKQTRHALLQLIEQIEPKDLIEDGC